MIPSDKRCEAVIFDFDGTLLDSFPAHYRAYEVMLRHFNKAISPEFYKQIYTPNWFAMYEALAIPEDRWEEADAVWLAEASRHTPQLFPQARPLLDALSEEYLLGLVTSGSGDRVRRDLALTGIGDRFQVIVTGSDISRPKPDPEGLQIALEKLNVRPSRALYVGDAREDCLMAHAAGVPFVGISAEFATVSEVEGCLTLAGLNKLGPYIAKRS